MMNCEICGIEITPEMIGENHYVARDNKETRSGLAAISSVNTEVQLYDVFDCPVCKCQNVIGARKRKRSKLSVEKCEEQLSCECNENNCEECEVEQECKEKSVDNEEPAKIV